MADASPTTAAAAEQRRLAGEIARILDEIRHSHAVLPRKFKELAALRSSSSTRFFPAFSRALTPLFDFSRRTLSAERIVRFVSKLAARRDDKDLAASDAFLEGFLRFLLTASASAHRAARFRACQIISEMKFAKPDRYLLLLHFPTPKPSSAPPTDHPIEVITRIRDFPDGKSKPPSALDVPPDSRSIRLHTEIGYRDFTLDGVSISADESLDAFYTRFIQSQIEGMRARDKCTIMMCGPTGSGKSHTMFVCAKQPGIVYNALSHVLGNGAGLFVQVGVLEIFSEEIYVLLNERRASCETLNFA